MSLRAQRSPQLANVPDYQPTFMALLFASIWDISALPPTEAPKYGWWEETDTHAARLWQNHTRDLNLNYEISRGFDPNTYRPRILNGDPKSSRTCFIATFFYLFSEMGQGQLDAVLVDWLMEQLMGDIHANEEMIRSGSWGGALWLWCAMFGAAVVSCGRVGTAVERRQLERWSELCDEKIKLVSEALDLRNWNSARLLLLGPTEDIDEGADGDLSKIWNRAVSGQNDAEQHEAASMQLHVSEEVPVNEEAMD